jgi:hypothetical protein
MKPFVRELVNAALITLGILSAGLAFIHYHEVTHDHLLSAVFGGFFIGAGIGLAIRRSGLSLPLTPYPFPLPPLPYPAASTRLRPASLAW